jgi:hypothetical protein
VLRFSVAFLRRAVEFQLTLFTDPVDHKHVTTHVHRGRGRPPGVGFDRMLKRFLIVEALITGIKIAVVAGQIGVSRSWASREAHTQQTRDIITDLLSRRAGELRALFDRSLDIIEEALSAEKLVMTSRSGSEVLCVGPDHRARLKAADRFVSFLQALKPYRPLPRRAARAPKTDTSRDRCNPTEQLLSRRADEIQVLFDRSLEVMAEAFKAEKFRTTSRGELVHLGPDHRARLKAVDDFLSFIKTFQSYRR